MAAVSHTSGSPLDADQLALLTAAFRHYDVDGNGRIDADEISLLFISLGMKLTQGEIFEMVRDADVDGDGCVSLNEFIIYMESHLEDNMTDSDRKESSVKKAFALMCVDGSGVLTADDIHRTLVNMGEQPTVSDVAALVAYASNGGSCVTYEDFKRVLWPIFAEGDEEE